MNLSVYEKHLSLEQRFRIAKARSRRLLSKFDEGQHPRDENGKWTDGGSTNDSSDSSTTASADYSSLRTMPTTIEGVSIGKKALKGTMLAVGGSSGITLSTSKRASAAWKDMKAYQEKAFASGWSSSSHPNHVVWHELAHVKVKNGSVDHDSYLTNLQGFNNPHFKSMAEKVSKYAGTNGHEFVAEVFAAVRAGRDLGPEVMNYYKHLKGPTP